MRVRAADAMPRRLAVLLILLSGCWTSDVLDEAFGPRGGTFREAIAAFPPERRAEFDLLQIRCTRCHTLNAVFAAHLRTGTWEDQVRRMIRKPGSAIPDADGARIASFLEYVDGRRRAGTP